MPVGSSKIRATAVVVDHRPDRSLKALEQVADLERADPDHGLSGFDFGQVEQVVDQGREPLGGLADELDLLLLLGG